MKIMKCNSILLYKIRMNEQTRIVGKFFTLKMKAKDVLPIDGNWKKFLNKRKAGKINNKNKSTVKLKHPKTTNDNNVVVISNGEKISRQKCVAVDCEMVGIGKNGSISLLARVSIVDSKRRVIYDNYVKPDFQVQVVDYRTNVSGIRPHDLKKGLSFETVQDDVSKIFSVSDIVVGHSIGNDLKSMKVMVPKSRLRDIASCIHLKELAQINTQRVIGLRSLASSLLSESIQTGEHSSVQDAIATMQLYLLVKENCTKQCAPKYK